MRVYGAEEFKFKGTSLYLAEQETGFEIIPFNVYGVEMWRILWPDQAVSEDYYNKVRAKEHCIHAALSDYNTKKPLY